MTAPMLPITSMRRLKDLLLRKRLTMAEETYAIAPENIWPILRLANQGRTRRQSKLSEEILEKDWDIAQAIQTRTAAVTSTEWDIIPARGATDPDAAAAVAADIKGAVNAIPGNERLEYMNFRDLLTFLVGTAFLPGFSIAQIEWIPGGGDVLGFSPMPSWFFTHKNSRRPRVVLEDSMDGRFLSPDKFIIHEFLPRHTDPCRGGLIRPLAWLFAFKNSAWKDLLRYVEKFGMPFVFGTIAAADEKVWETEAEKLMDVIENFASDGGGVFSRNTEMEFRDGVGSGGDVYYSLFDLIERKIQQIVLGQTSTSDSKNSNRSTAQVHDLVRHDIRASDCRLLESTITKYFLSPFTKFRHGPDAPVPEMSFDVTSWEITNLMLDVVVKANSAGFTLENVEELNRQSGLRFVPIPYASPPVLPESRLTSSEEG